MLRQSEQARAPRRAPSNGEAQSLPRPLYISSDGGEPIFAFFHAAQQQAEVAVLICPPFGEEDMSSYRSRREWATALAGDGFATLRFDFPGSGDSGGGPRDEERVRAWTEAVDASARWLSETSGAQRIVALGIGLGGAIAYRALALGAPIDDLVLWGVCARGSRHLRELRAFSLMAAPQLQEDAASALSEQASDGSLEVSGYVLSAETQRELGELDLAQLDCRLDAARVLLLERDGRAVDTRLREAIERGGAELTVDAGDGYASMMMAGLPNAVSADAVLETVTSWLSEERLTGARVSRGRSSLGRVSDQPASSEISMPDGQRVRETTVTIAHGSGELFGILAEPIGPTAELCAIWLNAGPVRRTGPNRMWVETARRWAALGVPSFRVDLAGIGDADGDASALLEVRSYYTSDFIEQVRLVIDTLQARGLPARFLLGGLCAGGYWALQIAQEDTRVSTAIALNPGYLVYDGGLSNAVSHGRSLLPSLFARSTWRRLARGEITLSAHLTTLRTLLGALARRLLRIPSRLLARGAAPDENEIARAFEQLQAQDQRALVLFVGEERLHAQLLAEGKLSGLERWPNVSLQHVEVPGDVHTLRPLPLQREAHRLVDEVLQRELELVAGAAAAQAA
jgi:alpha-beta hydrolase superfamily lysophospholipase